MKSIEDLYYDFLFEQRVKGNSAKTVIWYEDNVAEFIKWLESDDLESLNLQHYKEYIVYLNNYIKRNGDKLASSSINSKARAVRAFYNYAIDCELIHDISRKLTVPKVHHKETEILEDDEIAILMNSFEDDTLELRNKCFAALMLDSGLRRGEPIKLKMKDVDLEHAILLVNGKGDKQRYVPLGQISKSLLERYMHDVREDAGPNDYFFVDRFGHKCSDNLVKMAFHDLKERTGIERLHPHLLRHTFATLYLIDGGDLETLRLILGHSSITVTQGYLHLAFNYKLMHSQHTSHLDQLFTKK